MTRIPGAGSLVLVVTLLASSALAGCAMDDGTPADEAEASLAENEQAVSGGLFTVQGFSTATCPPFTTVGTNTLLSGNVSYNANNQSDFDFYVNVWQGIYDDQGHHFEDSSTWNLVRANTAIWWNQTQKFPYLYAAYTTPGDVTLTALTYITDSLTGQVVYTNASNACRFHVY